MALINCSECNKPFSDKASACPECACPIEEMIIDKDLWLKEILEKHNYDRSKSAREIRDTKELRERMEQYKSVNYHGGDAYDENTISDGLKSLYLICFAEKKYPQIQNQNTPKCPTCSSENISALNAADRMLSVGVFGFAGGSIGKSFVCNNCKYKW